MDGVRAFNLRGADMWARCDHRGTRLADGRAVTLDGVSAGGGPSGVGSLYDTQRSAWMAAQGGAIVLPSPFDRCDEDEALITAHRTDGFAFSFRGRKQAEFPFPSLSMIATPDAPAWDPCGRFWILDAADGRQHAFSGHSLDLLATLSPPAGMVPVRGTAFRDGLLLWDPAAGRLHLRGFSGERGRDLTWHQTYPFGDPSRALMIALAGGPFAAAHALFLHIDPGGERLHALARIGTGGVTWHVLPETREPLPLLNLADDEVLVGFMHWNLQFYGPGPNPTPNLTAFMRYRILEGALVAVDAFEARGHDGLGLALGPAGSMLATTGEGFRALYRREPKPLTEGTIETFALDSGSFAMAWHRIFLDVCLPEGTSLEVEAMTSDRLPPDSLSRLPGSLPGYSPPALVFDNPGERLEAAWKALPIATRDWADAGDYRFLAALDNRETHADLAWKPAFTGPHPVPPGTPAPDRTLEGLLPTPPGRYLWLRLRLIGSGGRSPRLFALRASFARPSMLRHLPAFWRAETSAASALDRFLSLFEGFTTEIGARLEAMHRLFSACGCPPAELDWLAGFLAQALDPRLPSTRQRALIASATLLHKERGTARGLERLCTILTGSRSVVMEGFRTRGMVSMLSGLEADGSGTLPAVLGSFYRLGMDGTMGASSGEEPYERELREAREKLLQERRAIRDAGGSLCPSGDPELFLDGDPLKRSFQRFAHRFTVVAFCEPDGALRSIVELAVERYKPAHTVHQLCFARAGLRVGQSSYVGLGTQLGAGEAFHPARLGRDGLGRRILGYADPRAPARTRPASAIRTAETAPVAGRIDPR